jgi:hypothetical protein
MGSEEKPPQEAAGDQVDRDRLLPGEDLGSDNAEDAEHWVDTYSELLDFKNWLLETSRSRLATFAQAEAKQEIESTDLTVLNTEAERFAGRLGFWRRRLDELKGRG